VGAVPDLERLLADALEAAGQAHVDVPVDRTAREGLGRGERDGEVASRCDDDGLRAVRAG
jgi:hypothetical protein